jgi:hypothetical protein
MRPMARGISVGSGLALLAVLWVLMIPRTEFTDSKYHLSAIWCASSNSQDEVCKDLSASKYGVEEFTYMAQIPSEIISLCTERVLPPADQCSIEKNPRFLQINNNFKEGAQEFTLLASAKYTSQLYYKFQNLFLSSNAYFSLYLISFINILLCSLLLYSSFLCTPSKNRPRMLFHLLLISSSVFVYHMTSLHPTTWLLTGAILIVNSIDNLVGAPRLKANRFLLTAGIFLSISSTRMGFLVAFLSILISLYLSTDFNRTKLKNFLFANLFNSTFFLFFICLSLANTYKTFKFWGLNPHTFDLPAYFNNIGGFPGYLNMLAKSLFGGDLNYEMASAIANYRIQLPSLFVSSIYSIYIIFILYAFIHYSLSKKVITLFLLSLIFIPGAIYALSSNEQFNAQSHHLVPFFVLYCWSLAALTKAKYLKRLIFVFLMLLYTQSAIALVSIQPYYSATYHLFFSKLVSELLSSGIFICFVLLSSFSLVISPFIPKKYLKILVK